MKLIRGNLFALGSVVYLATALAAAADTFQTGVVIHKKYDGFSDEQGAVQLPNGPDALFNDPRYPNVPDRTDLLSGFEYPAGGVFRVEAVDPTRNYFDTMEGYFIPPATGDYVFFTSVADRIWLYLSTDEDPANKHLIVAVSGWSDPRSWLTSHDFDVSQSRSDTFSNSEWPGGNPISLTEGQKYYMLMVHHDPSWAGGDWFSATFKLAGEDDPANGEPPRLMGDLVGSYTGKACVPELVSTGWLLLLGMLPMLALLAPRLRHAPARAAGRGWRQR